ncbi:hypothetical protein KKC97_07945 [bacterium]|nr:hypothetical protein [bacterium]MBU1637580.1 hypothetical protein [bacterium]MBU1920891.1 hypothetical protein [bacterium]
MKVNPLLTPYRPVPPQYLPPVSPKTSPETVHKTSKSESVDTKRLTAEEKLRQAIEEKQVMLHEAGVDGIPRAPELGKLLDLRA